MGLLHIGPFLTCLLPSRLLITPQSSSSNALLSGLPLALGPSLWFPLGTTSSVPAALSRHDVVMPAGHSLSRGGRCGSQMRHKGWGAARSHVSGSWDLNPVPLRATHLQQSPVGKRDSRRSSTLSCPQTCPSCSQNLCILSQGPGQVLQPLTLSFLDY